MLCRHHHQRGNPQPMKQSRPTPYFSTTTSWQALICFLCLNLPILDIFYERKHKILHDLLCLSSSTEQKVFEVLYVSMQQNFIPFYDWVTFHCMDGQCFVHLFIRWWTSELSPPFGYCEYCCYEHSCSIFLHTLLNFSQRYTQWLHMLSKG